MTPQNQFSFVMKKSIARSWKHLANERLENQKPTIPLGPKFWPLSHSEREVISTNYFKPLLAPSCHVDALARRRCPVEVLDAAYWTKGCSSLGLLRFAVLLGIGNGKEQ